MGKANSILLLLFLVYASALGQYRYMVYFSDKNGSSYSTGSPLGFLSQRAVDRRVAQGISVIEEDLPVVASYVDAVGAINGVTVLYKSKWFNGVLVECDPGLVSELIAMPFVTRVQFAAGSTVPNGRVRSSRKMLSSRAVAEVTDSQLSMIGIDQMHADGYRGEGMLIAILDSGFPGADTAPQFKHVFDEGRVNLDASYNFAYRTQNVFGYDPDAHGTHVWSVIAGYDPGVFVGGAYKANFLLYVTEANGPEDRVEEFNWLFAAERADSAGVDVINTSLGYNTFDDDSLNYTIDDLNGSTTIISRAAEIAASKGIVVVVAAGNEAANSWGKITAPADAQHVLAIGGVTSTGSRISSSSFGPTADGRTKPDVMTQGQSVSIVRSNGALGTASGTSVASPLATSLAAGVWQALPDLTAYEIMDTIRNTASQANTPDNLLGYGIPSYYSIFNITSVALEKANTDIYPNPASSRVIFLGKDVTAVNKVIAISTTSAETILPFASELPDRIVINVANLAQGTYIIQMHTNLGMKAYKLHKID